jgi:hypothetical protein
MASFQIPGWMRINPSICSLASANPQPWGVGYSVNFHAQFFEGWTGAMIVLWYVFGEPVSIVKRTGNLHLIPGPGYRANVLSCWPILWLRFACGFRMCLSARESARCCGTSDGKGYRVEGIGVYSASARIG